MSTADLSSPPVYCMHFNLPTNYENPLLDIITIRKDPLGRCMYCENGVPPFTNEHIMSRGLNGEWLLPESTCDICKKEIDTFETPVLKSGWLSDPRLVLGLRSYKAKNQPTHIKMTFLRGNGKRFTAFVPKEKAVALISMPILIEARFLTSLNTLKTTDGMEIYGTADAKVCKGAFDKNGKPNPDTINSLIQELCGRYGASGIDLKASIRAPQIMRFLCKIAHGFHIWERGMFPLSESPALELLMARRTDYSNWIGAKNIEPSQGEKHSLHEVFIEDGITKSGAHYTLVNIVLFNPLGPGFAYQVITRAPGWQAHTTKAPVEQRPKGNIHLVTAID